MLIGDEMGVGKTIQALAVAYLYKSEWPLLVICPSSLVFKLNNIYKLIYICIAIKLVRWS